MPEISRFYGIIIKMYYDDHPPAHFHAYYGDFEVVVNIETLGVLAGNLPPRAMGLVTEWGTYRQEELRAAWENARQLQKIGKIEPLS